MHSISVVQKVWCPSVCPESVLWETADWIRMPFGVVSGVGRGMGVLDFGVVIFGGEGQFWG